MAGQKTSFEPGLIVYFDGVCSLCNVFIDFLVRVDHRRRLRYAPLQGTTAQARGIHTGNSVPPSIVVLDGSLFLTESDAVLRIFSLLGGVWTLCGLARVIPKSFRDAAYRLIARNRYRIFGRRDTCRVPSPVERELFLP